ncbi:Peptidyl-tRNA hydrolase ICT1, mitochondrial, partial [Dufourea novaeangliae]
MNMVSRNYLRIFQNNIAQQNHFSILSRVFAYKSAFSLEKLYPTSNLKLYTPTYVPEDETVKFNGFIPINELQITYSRSSGAGGQHVNRTNSKVDLRFQVESAKWLSEEVKQKLMEQYKNKLNKDGYFIIKSELTRSQQLNLADALQKLRTAIRDAIKPTAEVSEETAELKRKQLLRSARKRLHDKRMHSDIK